MSKRRRKPRLEPKTPRLEPEQSRMLATSANDIAVQGYSDIMTPQDETLLAKGGAKGIRLYDEVKRDGHARSVLTKRVLKVLAREWMLQPGSDDPRDVEARDFVDGVLKRLAFDKLCGHLLWATLYGFAPAEIQWAITPEGIVPASIDGRHQARIVFDLDWQPRLITRDEPLQGEEQPERKWIIHRVGGDGADPYGEGLGKVLFWHVLFKREGVGFWSYFLEKFASPTPVGKYPVGTPPSEQQRLLQNLAALVQQGALAIPIGTEVEFLQNATTAATTYEEWCRFWDEQSSVAVLGENLSTNMKGQGARAAVQTHDAISDLIADADSDLLSATLNSSLIIWLIDYNRPGCKPPTVWRPRPKNEQQQEEQATRKAERQAREIDNLFGLANRGFRPSAGLQDAVSRITGEEYVADDSLIGRYPTGPSQSLPSVEPPNLPPDPGFADHDHGLGELADDMEEVGQDTIDDWIKAIRRELDKAIASGEDFASFSDRLLNLYPQLEVDQLGQVIARGNLIADLKGRADVKEEVK